MTLNSWKRLVAAVLDDAVLASQGGVRRLYLGGRLGGCVCSGLVGLLGQAVLGGRLFVLHPPPNPRLLASPFTPLYSLCALLPWRHLAGSALNPVSSRHFIVQGEEEEGNLVVPES